MITLTVLFTILVVVIAAVVIMGLISIICSLILAAMAMAGCSYSIYLVGGLTEWALAHTLNKTLEKEEKRA